MYSRLKHSKNGGILLAETCFGYCWLCISTPQCFGEWDCLYLQVEMGDTQYDGSCKTSMYGLGSDEVQWTMSKNVSRFYSCVCIGP
jgi:hypothetical protein